MSVALMAEVCGSGREAPVADDINPRPVLAERIQARRNERVGALRHGQLYSHLVEMLEAWPDREAAAEWRAELLSERSFLLRSEQWEPAYRYFEKLVGELKEAIRQCSSAAEADAVLSRKRNLMNVLPEAAPALASELDLHVRAVKGDKNAAAALAMNCPY